MLAKLVVGLALLAPGVALACGGEACESCEATAQRTPNASNCARKAELVGTNCSYTTGVMTQRVLAEGTPFTYTGRLAASANSLDSRVAAPFTAGPDEVYVVANEVLEQLTEARVHEGRVSLEGRLLEVGGIQYLVLTDYAEANS